MNDGYECKSERMKKYLEQVRKWVDDIQAKFVQADCLARAALAEYMLILNNVLSFV